MPIYLHMRIFTTLLLLVLSLSIQAQSIQRMWASRDYDGLYAQRDRVTRMGGRDMLYVAQAAQHFDEDSTAIFILKLAIDKGYGTDQHYYRLGLSYAKKENYLEAAHNFHQALALNHDRLPFMLAKADSYYRANVPDSAIAVFTRIHKFFPENSTAAFMSCKIMEEEQYYLKAIECFEFNIPDIKESGYKNEAREITANLTWHVKNDTNRAAQLYADLIRDNQNSVRYRMLLLQLFVDQNDWTSALQLYAEMDELISNGEVPSIHKRKNTYPLIHFDDTNYRTEIYRVVNPTLDNGALFYAYIVTPQHARPVAKWTYRESEDGEYTVTGEGLNEQEVKFSEPMNLQEFSSFTRSIVGNL